MTIESPRTWGEFELQPRRDGPQVFGPIAYRDLPFWRDLWAREFERYAPVPASLEERKVLARAAGLVVCDCVWVAEYEKWIWVPWCEVHARCEACGRAAR